MNFEVLQYFVETVVRTCLAGGLAKGVSFTIQSNGTVMTRRIAEFLKAWNISIGISLDGPENIHDRNRVFRSGRGSWDPIMRTLDTLRKTDIAFGLLAVIESPDDVEPVYDFLASQNPLVVRMNLRRVNGRSQAHISEAMLTQIAEAHYSVFRRSLAAYRSGTPAPREANICHMIENMSLQVPRYMCQRTPCGAGIDQIVFDCAGNAWACQEFVGDERYKIAAADVENVGEAASAHEILRAMRSRRLDDAEECRSCAWTHFCQGGCFATTYHAAGADFAAAVRKKTPHCAYLKHMFRRLIWDLCNDHEALLGYALCGQRGFLSRSQDQAVDRSRTPDSGSS
jgi:uncharacterized protein